MSWAISSTRGECPAPRLPLDEVFVATADAVDRRPVQQALHRRSRRVQRREARDPALHRSPAVSRNRPAGSLARPSRCSPPRPRSRPSMRSIPSGCPSPQLLRYHRRRDVKAFHQARRALRGVKLAVVRPGIRAVSALVPCAMTSPTYCLDRESPLKECTGAKQGAKANPTLALLALWLALPCPYFFDRRGTSPFTCQP